jgi:hypothetical protein
VGGGILVDKHDLVNQPPIFHRVQKSIVNWNRYLDIPIRLWFCNFDFRRFLILRHTVREYHVDFSFKSPRWVVRSRDSKLKINNMRAYRIRDIGSTAIVDNRDIWLELSRLCAALHSREE